MARSAAGIALFLILSMMAAHVSEGREMLAHKKNKGTCEKPPTNKVKVPKGIDVIVLKGEGNRVFYCNGGELDRTPAGRPHGETEGVTVVSDDKQWKGKFSYRKSDGHPEFVIKNKKTGEKMTVVASQKPQAREDAPNGSALTWDRRVVEEYKFDGEGPEIKYVVRNDTESEATPTKCKGDTDKYAPFTATYTFVACSAE